MSEQERRVNWRLVGSFLMGVVVGGNGYAFSLGIPTLTRGEAVTNVLLLCCGFFCVVKASR